MLKTLRRLKPDSREKKLRYDQLYLDLASRIGEMSHSRRLEVGCVVVKDGQIISHGWNGMPAGWDNNCEDYSVELGLYTKPEVSHAEENTIGKLASSQSSAKGATMYITHSPCINCAKLINTAKIKKVVYGQNYRSDEGIVFLKKCGVTVERL